MALKTVGAALERSTESSSPGIRFALAVRKTRVTRTAFADLGWQPC